MRNGGISYYAQLDAPTHVARNVIYITQTLLGDIFVVRSTANAIVFSPLTQLLTDLSTVRRVEPLLVGYRFANTADLGHSK